MSKPEIRKTGVAEELGVQGRERTLRVRIRSG